MPVAPEASGGLRHKTIIPVGGTCTANPVIIGKIGKIGISYHASAKINDDLRRFEYAIGSLCTRYQRINRKEEYETTRLQIPFTLYLKLLQPRENDGSFFIRGQKEATSDELKKLRAMSYELRALRPIVTKKAN